MPTDRKRAARAPDDAPTSRARDPWAWATAGAVLVAALVRFADLGGKSLWFDEALSLEDSASLAAKFGSGFHPPLFYALLHAWARVAGSSDAALRLVAAVPGTLAVAFVALAARRMFGWRAAAFSAALLALASLHVEYSQEVRMYALATMFVALATWVLAEALARLDAPSPDPRALWALAAAYTGAAYAAAATHYLAAFVVAAHALALLASVRRTRPLVWRLAALEAPALAAAALVLVTTGYARQIGVAADFFVTAHGVNQTLFDDVPGRLARLPLDLATQVLPGFNLKWLVIARYRWPAVAAFDLAALAAFVLVARRRDASAAVRLATLLPATLPLVATLLMVGPEQLRFYVTAAPAVALAVGAGLDAARPRWAGAAALAVLLAVSSLAVWWYFDPGMDKQPWRRVATLVSEQSRPGDAVLVNEPHLTIAFERYFRPRPGVEVDGYPEVGGFRITPDDLDRWFFPLVRDRSRVWYVRMSATASHSDPDELALKWLAANMRPVTRLREPGYNGDIDVFLFER
jgi:uncharacterized membrane protein